MIFFTSLLRRSVFLFFPFLRLCILSVANQATVVPGMGMMNEEPCIRLVLTVHEAEPEVDRLGIGAQFGTARAGDFSTRRKNLVRAWPASTK